jgi:lipopolysaccharide transport protein LptA
MTLAGERVTLSGDRGDLAAPRVVWETRAGVARASGGVQATLAAADGAFAGTPLGGGGGGPVRVESAEAEWRQADGSFLFRGQVRAWRGEDLLRAEELRGEPASGTLDAGGRVKTVWTRREPEGAPDPEPAAPAREPLEVAAERLHYVRETGRLTYSGGVVVRQGTLTLTCAEVEVELDAQERARRMTCGGGVALKDPAAGREVTGERAAYDLEAGALTVFGHPVVLVDRERGRAEGGQLVYDLESRSVRLLAAAADGSGGDG